MMRHPRKAGKQNMGFSLVEVLVTLALISVLSIPLIQTFVNSARVNGKAKSMQNATDIAQSISEYFGAMPLDALKTAYKGKYTSMSDGRIVFTNIGDGINKDSDGVDYYKGSDTEKFYVSVIVDPTGYSKADKTGMNDYIRPGINNLNENSSITCRSKLEQYDTNIVNTFKEKGVNVVSITLHVGLGTFRPVKVDKIEEHHMHTETFNISKEAADTINRTRAAGGRVIAVGTTSCRTLESAAADDGTIPARSGDTDIFIYPGYKFKAIDCLITNFHLPESTLIMLVSALAGRDNIMNAYETAVKERYRFFSFGDAMFIC